MYLFRRPHNGTRARYPTTTTTMALNDYQIKIETCASERLVEWYFKIGTDMAKVLFTLVHFSQLEFFALIRFSRFRTPRALLSFWIFFYIFYYYFCCCTAAECLIGTSSEALLKPEIAARCSHRNWNDVLVSNIRLGIIWVDSIRTTFLQYKIHFAVKMCAEWCNKSELNYLYGGGGESWSSQCGIPSHLILVLLFFRKSNYFGPLNKCDANAGW